MARITTIVHFSMPVEHVDEFLATWEQIKEFMLAQPGALDGTMHGSTDDDSPFQLVNVAHWETRDALANALRASAEKFKSRGIDLVKLFQRLNVRMSQNNYNIVRGSRLQAPVQLHVGTSEVLLGDSRRYAERFCDAGGEAVVHVWEDMMHVFPSSIVMLEASNANVMMMSAFLEKKLIVKAR